MIMKALVFADKNLICATANKNESRVSADKNEAIVSVTVNKNETCMTAIRLRYT